MRKLLIPFATLAFAAAPAAAQDEWAHEDQRPVDQALPDREELRAMTHGLDRMLGALLSIDVAPLLDAADPDGVRARGERTLGEIAGGDDPYFEERMRSNLYRSTDGIARMMDAFATMAPALRRSLETIERDLDIAADAYRR